MRVVSASRASDAASKLVKRGVRPIGKVRRQFQCFLLYGGVEPATGQSQFWLFTHLDSECFETFLQALSREYPEDLLVVQLDNVGFHCTVRMRVPENVFLVFQPPHSPEINPIEQVWLYLKYRLDWKAFESTEALECKVCEELQKLDERIILSLTAYPFLSEALFRSVL